MVKKSNSKNKSTKEVTVEKPKEASVTSVQPSQEKENKSLAEHKQELDITKLKDSIVSELKPKPEIIYPDKTKPRKRRQKKQSSTNQEVKTKESPVTLKKVDKGIGFYVGITIGLIVGTLGIYYLYTRYKSKPSELNKSEQELLDEIKRENLDKIEIEKLR